MNFFDTFRNKYPAINIHQCINIEWLLKTIDSILSNPITGFMRKSGGIFTGNVSMGDNKLYVKTPELL